MQKDFYDLFPVERPVIGVIHTGPSPGVPGFICVDSAVDRAFAEAEAYVEGGVDGIIIENMHDFPCVHEREMGPEIAAFMTRVARAVKRRASRLPVGVQVLFQGNRTALAVALGAGCDFVRAEGWTYAHVSDKGLAEACAGTAVRYRHQIGADHIPIFTDVQKKHSSHSLTSDLDIGDLAFGLTLHRSDGVIVTGSHTGSAPSPDDLVTVRHATELPILIGSGLTADNIADFAPFADGFIIGSAMKENGHWDAPVSDEAVARVVEAVRRVRGEVQKS
ncbi:MAG: membrane complex biogenesis BtpA family protein [Rhodothermales bacterium]|jgi:membrane complex biogenesis BtpA family protein